MNIKNWVFLLNWEMITNCHWVIVIRKNSDLTNCDTSIVIMLTTVLVERTRLPPTLADSENNRGWGGTFL